MNQLSCHVHTAGSTSIVDLVGPVDPAASDALATVAKARLTTAGRIAPGCFGVTLMDSASPAVLAHPAPPRSRPHTTGHARQRGRWTPQGK